MNVVALQQRQCLHNERMVFMGPELVGHEGKLFRQVELFSGSGGILSELFKSQQRREWNYAAFTGILRNRFREVAPRCFAGQHYHSCLFSKTAKRRVPSVEVTLIEELW